MFITVSGAQFVSFNTVDNGWDSSDLQDYVCEALSGRTANGTQGVISNTVIVGHSTGNLILAAALLAGKCTLDSTSRYCMSP